MNARRNLLSVPALALVALGVFACGAASPDGSGFDESTAKGSGNGEGSGSGSTGSGSTSGDDGIIDDGATGGGESGGFEECAKASEAATLVPVNMFITVDKSGSMNNDGKWDNAKAAFQAFFQDQEADSLRVALRFWPDSGCDENTCSVDICSQPQVGLGPLSDTAQEQALITAFANHSPGGNTPMYAALGGATKWATDHTAAGEGAEKTVVILVTDGEPNGCDENIGNIASQAANAYSGAGVMTFAVGMAGSNETDMNQIAAAGNTQGGFFIGNGNAQAELLAALKAIQKTAVACVFAMPESQGADPIDPALVNVTYTPSDGTGAETLGQVAGESSCGAAGGWYYDDPNNPAIIALCPQSCDLVQQDEGAKLDIILGCETKPA